MIFTKTAIDGMFAIDIEPHGDERGSFARAYCADEFKEQGIDFTLKQSNISTSKTRGTMRGLHYQVAPKLEAKIVRWLHTRCSVRRDGRYEA